MSSPIDAISAKTRLTGVVRGGKIVQMDVWNDSAERILTARGIVA